MEVKVFSRCLWRRRSSVDVSDGNTEDEDKWADGKNKSIFDNCVDVLVKAQEGDKSGSSDGEKQCRVRVSLRTPNQNPTCADQATHALKKTHTKRHICELNSRAQSWY